MRFTHDFFKHAPLKPKMHLNSVGSIILWILLCHSASCVTILQQNVTFRKQPVCPSNASLAQLSWLAGSSDSSGACFSACAANASCSVTHRANGVCYFGNSSQLAGLFNESAAQSSDPCISYTREDVRSKLVVLFDFRKSFSNLVSPGTFDATPHGSVTRDAQGAQFPGTSISDFIEVDTKGGSLITDFLDHPNNFSFFAKVVRQAWYSQSYHHLYNCTALDGVGSFGDRDGRAWVQHQFPGQSVWTDQVETRDSVSAPFTVDNTPQLVSLGAVFYGKNFNNFYLNGSCLQANPDKDWLIHAVARCLRLGYDGLSTPPHSLQGRMICYAIAKAALSIVEFQQLDLMCQE